MNLAKNEKLPIAYSRSPLALSLDHTKKRVYWLSEFYGIFSSNYDGVDRTALGIRLVQVNFLDMFEDSVYFGIEFVPYIIERNMTSRKIFRSIKVNRTDYRDLVVIHSSLQPMGELQRSFQYSWIFCAIT